MSGGSALLAALAAGSAVLALPSGGRDVGSTSRAAGAAAAGARRGTGSTDGTARSGRDPGGRRRGLLGRLRRAPEPLDVAAVVDAVATQVRAGAEPGTAWTVALEVVADTSGSGSGPTTDREGDGPVGAPVGAGPDWRDPAQRPVVAAWRLAGTTGAPLAEVLERVAESTRLEAEVEAQVAGSLAAPRATARLLGVLPFAGLGLGQLVGAHPFAVLLGTWPGRACAALGLGLLVAGRAWTAALLRAAERAS
ncbi:hypothetical protein GCM10025868_18300 [Angustibacter aerolatus]|uniref:Type II secretion system protein GspF domain-containing protein n=1 Tax=Angustibacter aerolatus TaxID=1162965 RepID=A0ABQ6JEI4_9ACTN|nr:hypothetical protein GCM10025868_18300 [Angustibacter aerolatus]